ncbi:Dynactin subunit 1 [Choanephora cucurbitarum]|uniref:Dynactin subunit 1 n=1 Tax=Choanephora cucurbitarum TaxID=101091 RepID=A0A1C7NCM1_9FUNG|nr:Dynactin subunit 1 [Choanephora cucurbitarum]
MFRKAKRLSQRLGLNKERCTGSDSCTKHKNGGYHRAANSNEQLAPPAMITDKASTSSDIEDDDTLSTKSTGSTELKSLATEKKIERPVLQQYQSVPNKPAVYDFQLNNTGNLELMLSLETQARIDAQAEREREEAERKLEQENLLTPPRPTRIKFELPVTPPRSRSPSRLAYPRARPIRSLPEEGLTANAARLTNKTKKSGWRTLFKGEDEEDDLPTPITIGTRVRLLKRPLPTFGHVRFIGGVHFGKGEWIGIELDHGVGNCDGSIDGQSYFDTDSNRGTFVKRHDLEATSD